MKPAFFLFLGILLFVAVGCSSEKNQKIEGDFIYIADAAVIKGDDFIYGIELDAAMQLADQVKPLKKDDFDLVPVILEGILKKKEQGAEGWDTIVKITKILKVPSKSLP